MNGRVAYLADLFHSTDQSHDGGNVGVVVGVEGAVTTILLCKALGEIFDHGCEYHSVKWIRLFRPGILTLEDL